MTRAAEGDQNAFRQLVRESGPRMFGQAYKLCGNAAAAEDIVQDALIKLWVHADRFNAQKGTANAYIARITHNCAVDYFRKNKTTAELLDHNIADEAENVEILITRKQQASGILSAIDTLADAQKEAVLLFYFHDLSTADVAGSMGKSVKAVERLLSRARSSLEEKLSATIKKGERHYAGQ